jgi:hypothetical protein
VLQNPIAALLKAAEEGRAEEAAPAPEEEKGLEEGT